MVELIADLERARLAADRHYNDTLSALDRAIVDLSGQNNLSVHDVARLTTALIVFLQQITAFVETKDREIEARLTARIETLAESLGSMAEWRTQIRLLQRTVERLSRLPAAGPSDASATTPPSEINRRPAAGDDDLAYLGFEDEFRGSEASIQAHLRDYLPLFAGASDVVDLGCGRGEFLQLLREQGITARGVDLNGEMAAAARAHGLEAAQGDALTYLAAAADASLGGVIATQVVEHLEPSYLFRLLREARRTLRTGSPIVLETINPACWLAFFSSYVRDLTHVRPVHPETLQYLLRANGFERVSLTYRAPVPEAVRMKGVVLPADFNGSSDPARRAIVETARIVNGNATILNSLLFSYQDYAAIGYQS